MSAAPAAGAAFTGMRPRWLGIQYLRGLAACGVVVFHCFDEPLAPAGRDFTLGRYGVDLFFVISGFIMYTVARGERVGPFLARRLTRIYPLYWIATATALLGYWIFDRIHPSGTELLKSLALWPHYSEAHRAEIWPVLVPGWSLSYELYFYALFALGLLCRRPGLVPAVLIGAALLAGVLWPPQAAPLRVATNPLLAEFVGGLFVAWAAAAQRRCLAPLAVIAGLAAIGLVAAGLGRFAAGAGALSLVAVVVLLEARGLCPPLAPLRWPGDASYSIYLFHLPLLLVVERTCLAPGATGTWPLAVLAIAGTVALGVLLHLWLEKPLLRISHRASRAVLAGLATARGQASQQ